MFDGVARFRTGNDETIRVYEHKGYQSDEFIKTEKIKQFINDAIVSKRIALYPLLK